MTNSKNKNGLKGQYNLAQGKRSREPGSYALGWRARMGIVRAKMFFKTKILFRTGEITSCFPELVSYHSVRKGLLALFIESRGRFFSCIPFPERRFGSFLPKLCPGLIYPGLSGRKSRLELVYKE
jgi:hypothetical protein